ncbi:hypothetical protein KKH26_02460 [Patescibacteria group bacterium]|nr:hypothetical protein [Patescibacteria group bacterium]
MPSMPVPTKKLGLLIRVISIVVLLGVVGGGALLATRVWDPLWSPFRPSPEEVISEAFNKMQLLKSSHSEIKLVVDTKDTDPQKVSLTLSGNSDNNDPENIKSDVKFNLSVVGENSFSLGGDFKMIGKDGYFRISEINVPDIETLFVMGSGIDLNTIKENWIKFPLGDQFTNQTAETKSFQETITRMVSENKVYTLNQLPDQKIEGQKIYCYLAVLDNEKTAKLLADIIVESMKQSGQSGQEMAILLGGGAIKGMVEEFLNKVGEINFELLVGKEDNLLHGLNFNKVIELTNFEAGRKGMASIDFEISNSKFNQPVAIEAPIDYKNFEEVFPPELISLLMMGNIPQAPMFPLAN